MELFHLLGYFSALIIGLSLGIIGGGGSILAVPVLVYLFSLDEKLATAYSLFIVGISALIGGFRQHIKGFVDWRIVTIFGVPAIISVTLVRYFVIPTLPDIILTIGEYDISRRMLLLGLFAFLMFPAAFAMLKKPKKLSKTILKAKKFNYPLILLEGIFVGGLTGLIGAGGGFLIIPALVILAKIDMKMAIGTSLIIIALKSLIGFFIGDVLQMELDWHFLLIFSSIAIIGILIGSYIGQFINAIKLKKVFGYFILLMAVFIIIKELSV